MPYTNHQWEVIARDYFSSLFRNHMAVSSFFRQAKLLDVPRVPFCIVSHENAIEYVADISVWIQAHETLKACVEADVTFLGRLLDTIEEECCSAVAWTEEHIFLPDLKTYSGEQLMELLRAFVVRQETLYAYGTSLVLLDFADFSFVEGNLKHILESKVASELYTDYFEVFTYPVHHSFGQDQEYDRLRLMQEFYSDPAWKKDVAEKSAQEIQRIYSAFWNKLGEHARSYGWVYYVYSGPAFTEEQFFQFIQNDIRAGIDPADMLTQMQLKEQAIEDKKKRYIETLHPNDFERAILEYAGRIVWAKPRRKDYQSKAYYHVEKLQREIARRLVLTLDQMRSCPLDMLEKGLAGEELDVHRINDIYRFHVCIANDDGTVSLFTGKEAETLNASIHRKTENVDTTVTEVIGTTGCPGTATGTVRIVNVPNDMNKMNDGDILVSTATTPSIVAAMKRAGAIVTDEGGLTCHASIVSRELNVPCVIGTKIATRVLKDGDRVEVDATRGIVKKI